MSKPIKPVVSKAETFDLLEIRLGQIFNIVKLPQRSVYKLEVDFGKFGKKTTVGRFTKHSIDILLNKKALGILNFESRMIEGVNSEFLLLGVQYPKAESGEATILSPLADGKIGSKVF